MSGSSTTVERLRVSGRSVILAVLGAGLAFALVDMFNASARVIGWLVAASIVAALLNPLVDILDRRMPRGFALLIVIVGVLGGLAYVLYGLVDDVRQEIKRVQVEAPALAERIEESERFGEFAREFELKEKVTEFVDELPSRLQGGSATEVIRSAATRFVAYLAGFILMIFLMAHGRRMAGAALRQTRDPARRAMFERVLRHAYRRWWVYVAGRIALSIVAGMAANTMARLADVPGPRAMGLFVFAWSTLPWVGVLVGSVPVIAFAWFIHDLRIAILVAAFFLVYQIADVVVCRRVVEDRSVHIGPVVTLLAAMFGFELYGIGGTFVAMAVAVAFVCVLDELAPTDDDVLDGSDAGVSA